MGDSIRLSEKHGLNPSVMLCPVCGNDTGLALMGKLKGDVEAPRNSLDQVPCDKCRTKFAEYKGMGFVLFGIDDEYEKMDREKVTPWQMFREVHVITHEAAERMFEPEMLKAGALFINVSILRQRGFEAPTQKVESVNGSE